MDRVKKYQKILSETLEAQTKISTANMPKVKSELIIDKAKKHFILIDIGWDKDEFIHDWVYHFELKNSKVYGHKNMIDFDIVGQLIKNGIAKKDIIISLLQESEFDAAETTQLGEAA